MNGKFQFRFYFLVFANESFGRMSLRSDDNVLSNIWQILCRVSELSIQYICYYYVDNQ